MARLIYGLNVSLDGHVDHRALGPPAPDVFRHFIERVRGATGMFYGRGVYEVLRYWDDEHDDWDDAEREYAQVWRSRPKWVASRSLTSVGPNATLLQGDLAAAAAKLKAELGGEIDVAGPQLAKTLGELGLIDEYRLYVRPVATGGGRPYFAGPAPKLRFVSSEIIGSDVVLLTYAPD